MNEIIKKIEAEQLKESVDEFNVGKKDFKWYWRREDMAITFTKRRKD